MDDGDSAGGFCRLLPTGDYVAVIPFLFTYGVVTGPPEHWYSYADRWCYHRLAVAVAAATAWDGTGEPEGWHRHPRTGRRRENGDPTREVVEP